MGFLGSRPGMAMTLLTAVTGLPLAGLLIAGRQISPYLDFPPKPGMISHAPFSMTIFTIILAAVAVSIAPLVRAGLKRPGQAMARQGRPMPWWGWTGLALFLVFWALAWTRMPWAASIQAHTFFPLWLSLILTINGLTVMRCGTCPLTAAPKDFARLFAVSAVFWWLFEYLNRFVGNWIYSGSDYGPCTYFLLATLSFSTVLPAVESMKALVMTFDRIALNFRCLCPMSVLNEKPAGIWFIALGSISLLLIPLFPDPLFFTVWVAPLLICWGLANVTRIFHPFAPLSHGDITAVAAYALAALICGFFWEMLNLYSLARWTYSIPYAGVLHIFEMPVLGYAGYLPFGLEAAMIIHLVTGNKTFL